MRSVPRHGRLLRSLIASLLLMGALFAPLLGRSAAAADPVELVFWNYWDGQNGEVIQELVDAWNAEHADIQVENVFIGFGDLLPKLQTAAAGGDAPDLAAGDLTWMPKLAKSGAVVPLNELAAGAGIDLTSFYPALIDASTFDGQTYGLPVSTNNLQLFYNKELFTKAGLDPNAPPTTWDELRAYAKQCANADEGISGMELFTEPGEGLTWQFQVYLWQAGGQFLTDDLSAAAFNSEAGAQALQFWVDLLQTDKSAPLAPWGQFGQGSACMVMDGSWMVGGMAADPPFDFGTAPMPTPANGGAATNMGGEQLVVFAQDPAKQAAAAQFMAYLTSPDVQREWDQQTGFMPVTDAGATDPAYLEWVDANLPQIRPFVEGQKDARNRPPVTNYPEISDAFSRELEAALLGSTSVADALAAAEEAVNGLLAANAGS